MFIKVIKVVTSKAKFGTRLNTMQGFFLRKRSQTIVFTRNGFGFISANPNRIFYCKFGAMIALFVILNNSLFAVPPSISIQNTLKESDLTNYMGSIFEVRCVMNVIRIFF